MTLSIALSVVFLTSCKSIVEEEFLISWKVPVINSLLIADSIFKVNISFSGNLTEVEYPYVSDAIVIIKDSDNNSDTLNYSDKGTYISDETARIHKQYFCLVKIPGYNDVVAEAFVPKPGIISNVIFNKDAGRGEETELVSSVEFDLNSIPDEKIYWEVNFIERGIFSEYDFIQRKVVDSYKTIHHDIYFNPDEIEILKNETPPYNVFSNHTINKSIYHVKFYFTEYSVDLDSERDFYIELRNVDESYYEFQKQYYLYEMAANVGLGNSNSNYPLYTNIENGLGLFTAYSTTYAEVFVK
ncbi:DUF4249 family protein [Saccharicrinis sp. FJH2]|uniref:DUF4249 family protein n=1 Tax=Saccharicrinis sp. FJH65 TaxID=3344659 RepID=UPI0035F3B234